MLFGFASSPLEFDTNLTLQSTCILRVVGSALISKAVFDKLPEPWFDFNRKMGYGEDVNFCQRMIAAKFKPSVHFGVCVGHIGPTLWMPEGAKQELVKREVEYAV